ncbi:nucleotidyl transferase AbiEii/AbiGii toxin family protein [Hujiaoplasma nucleasis]|uniref:Nucleotidyl transferase AbiEii/AbiGii toxin family protein n=2 Tax=Hujiaoplasma nucleasis TaxID=2725268 RepID=A0A7L6N5S4_9MOLU|nr:nucleotidyl transferase AbiEii/AbiGii toxin family protein [Hujiaoplasma nucleasis]
MMKLHLNKELFENYIALASQEEDIDEAIVLKDYFVTLALEHIYAIHDDLVFIGGTSLSKCFNIINRFSEDIDLVATAKSRKGKQKATHEIINELASVWAWNSEATNDKYADFKEMYLYYDTNAVSDLDQRVKLELITFMDPFPVIEKNVVAIIFKYLDQDEIDEFDMHPVAVLTQEPYRTFFEKITLEKELFKNDIEGNPLDETQEKRARDFYDIHKIWNFYDKAVPIDIDNFNQMITSRHKHRKNRTIVSNDEFNQYKLYEMFKKKNIRKQLEEVDFRKLSIRDLDCDDIETSLKEIDDFFQKLIV